MESHFVWEYYQSTFFNTYTHSGKRADIVPDKCEIFLENDRKQPLYSNKPYLGNCPAVTSQVPIIYIFQDSEPGLHQQSSYVIPVFPEMKQTLYCSDTCQMHSCEFTSSLGIVFMPPV